MRGFFIARRLAASSLETLDYQGFQTHFQIADRDGMVGLPFARTASASHHDSVSETPRDQTNRAARSQQSEIVAMDQLRFVDKSQHRFNLARRFAHDQPRFTGRVVHQAACDFMSVSRANRHHFTALELS